MSPPIYIQKPFDRLPAGVQGKYFRFDNIRWYSTDHASWHDQQALYWEVCIFPRATMSMSEMFPQNTLATNVFGNYSYLFFNTPTDTSVNGRLLVWGSLSEHRYQMKYATGDTDVFVLKPFHPTNYSASGSSVSKSPKGSVTPVTGGHYTITSGANSSTSVMTLNRAVLNSGGGMQNMATDNMPTEPFTPRSKAADGNVWKDDGTLMATGDAIDWNSYPMIYTFGRRRTGTSGAAALCRVHMNAVLFDHGAVAAIPAYSNTAASTSLLPFTHGDTVYLNTINPT